ncbi:alpha-L-rhamnosidase-related protein [Puniceicoccus vermicola]|uniref:Alpha-L-rhamnosidase six-hairpin glycosidase domain-containing protein n=1 Tax=Puniceicoccus vermicola TaxID=388746 RepID=A0A7X1AUT3_9BACT|nr:hypothetical protein [Puniceicoccus vermicola]MBC2600413.1 hypothetical protein [Puniceicoccus vermicola]
MKEFIDTCPPPESVQWTWADQEHPNQTVLFRTRITGLEDYGKIAVQITAQTRFYLYANGEYLGQGPCPSIWPDSTYNSYSVEASEGVLNLAVIVHSYGVRTQSHALAPAGLWARLIGLRDGSWMPIEIVPEAWKHCPQGGWISTQLRRTWATGWMEQFDSAKHPEGWLDPDFDDSSWTTATRVGRPGSTLSPRMTPDLREYSVPATRLRAVAKVSNRAPITDEGEGQLAKILDEEAWQPKEIAPYQSDWDQGRGIRIPAGEEGLALMFDLGEEMVGQTEFSVEAASGIVDHYGAELLRDGRPWAFRGNAEYATRWFASGRNPNFRTLNYNGFRYLLIVLRPDTSPMHLQSFGVWRREADIRPSLTFDSTDPEMQRLWDVSMRTLQVATQETNVDCPTREQALFIADGLWNALWIDQLFDEPSLFEHYLRIVAKAQHENGLMPSAVFSSLNPPHYLIDFCLIFVWGVDVYRRLHPERRDLVEELLPVAERTLRWAQDQIAESGLIEVDPLAIENYDGGRFEVVFLDHPTIWHTFSHPGIERSRIQLALNAFLAIAIDAFSASAEALGYAHRLDVQRLDAERIRKLCHERFWQAERGYYADCFNEEDNALKGWSAQTQVLAVLSGITGGDDAHQLMERLIRDWKHPNICRCTPYFWVYFAEALIVSGHSDQVMPLIREAWSVMTDDPETTTWWETFEGSDRDTRCHPWSALPAWFLQADGLNFRLCGERKAAKPTS